MQTMAMKAPILVLGGAAAEAKFNLIRDILKRTKNDLTLLSNSAQQPMAVPWTLDTKYYTVDLKFWIDSIEENSAENKESNEDKWSEVAAAVDAVIYVFDPLHPETMNPIKTAVDFIKTIDPEVLLCVAAKSTESPSEAVLDEVSDWCVENGFEFIDLNDQEPIDLSSTGTSYDEKFGIERVIEALESNMWKGMRRKAKDSIARATENDTQNDEIGFVQESMEFLEIDDQFDGVDGLPSLDEVKKMHDALFGDDEEEDGLERAVERLKQLRDIGKNMDDQARHDLAARVALSLLLE
ncbi:hypothetical protein HDV05_006889 [Chytridiales sp. JEL 0842]|nr:hypothetical protein HDV05_006889 [Chytridiales sp. JEL 0842]